MSFIGGFTVTLRVCILQSIIPCSSLVWGPKSQLCQPIVLALVHLCKLPVLPADFAYGVSEHDPGEADDDNHAKHKHTNHDPHWLGDLE